MYFALLSYAKMSDGDQEHGNRCGVHISGRVLNPSAQITCVHGQFTISGMQASSAQFPCGHESRLLPNLLCWSIGVMHMA